MKALRVATKAQNGRAYS